MSVNSKMTAIADEIRTLSGTTGTMSLDAMASNVAEANANVNIEANLIAQITSALEGKANNGGSNDECALETGELSFVTTMAIVNPGATSYYLDLENITNIGIRRLITLVCKNTHTEEGGILNESGFIVLSRTNINENFVISVHQSYSGSTILCDISGNVLIVNGADTLSSAIYWAL